MEFYKLGTDKYFRPKINSLSLGRLVKRHRKCREQYGDLITACRNEIIVNDTWTRYHSCVVSSLTFPFIRIRFRNRFRNPSPYCRSVNAVAVRAILFRRRPGPPNMEGARRYAGSVCISLTRKRTMFVYYSSLLLIFRLPRTSWHIGTLRATPPLFSTNWLEFS